MRLREIFIKPTLFFTNARKRLYLQAFWWVKKKIAT